MGSSQGAPTPAAYDSNAAGADPSFGTGWNTNAKATRPIQLRLLPLLQ
jgi:hypothetical protein